MKRLSVLLLCMILANTSCTLLTELTNTLNANTPQNRVDTVVTTNEVVTPYKRLIKTQDPGTGLYGYLNEFGTWAIQPVFRQAYSFDRDINIAVVQIKNYLWGAINSLGQTVIDFKFTNSSDVYSAVSSIKNGRYRGIDLWVMEDHETGLYGFLDYYGNWQIMPQFEHAYNMNSDGLAVVQFSTGGWGVIDRIGNIVIQPNFNSSSDAYSALNALRY